MWVSRTILRPSAFTLSSVLGILSVGLLVGCASSAPPSRPREGPSGPAMLRVDPGSYDGTPARRIISAHYVVETTIEDEEFVQSLGQLMEGALAEYQQLAPGVPLSG